MSCYIALTLPRHVIVAADSLRRIWGKSDSGPFSKPILLDDARKLHPLSDFCWITGIGISGFHRTAADHIKAFLGVSHRSARFSTMQLQKGTHLRKVLVRTYEQFMEEAVDLERAIGGSLLDPRRVQTDLLLAAISAEDAPVLVHFSSSDAFTPGMVMGSGQTACSPLSSEGHSLLEVRVREYLQVAAEQLMHRDSKSLEKGAYSIFPAIMAMIAEARPGMVSASGDMVIIGPTGTQRSLF